VELWGHTALRAGQQVSGRLCAPLCAECCKTRLMADVYSDFEQLDSTFLGETRTVFRAGSGPAVIVMHEAPGLYPEVAEFGRKVVREGFTVYMPSLVGTPGKPLSAVSAVETLARACVMREFTVWATRHNSPVTDWLRALARHAHGECGGPGVGAIGMCLTGGFALAMAADDTMLAPVLSQPSLPLAVTRAQRRDVGIDDATLARVRERTRNDGLCVLGLRFTKDRLVPRERFDRLRQELGDNFVAIEIDNRFGNPDRIPLTAHSVLVHDLVDEPGHPTRQALDQVMQLLRDRLLG